MLLACARFFQAVIIKLQRLRPGQVLERVRRQPNLGRDILEKVLHRTTTGLIEVTNPVIHVFEDIGELIPLDADRASRKRKALEIFKRRVGDLRTLCDIIDRAESASKSNSEAGQGPGCRCGCCNKRCLDNCPELAGLSLSSFGTVLKFSGVKAKIDAKRADDSVRHGGYLFW
ncbi:hypothetical protein [Agrobacterium tumefaciens]|uniref:hypothetical protein n=1 Tax=Agrobacterium tumefaciens TaxID=358 RepID=UPI003BA07865